MFNLQAKKAVRYVAPTILSNVCFFLFTVVDGIFVGNGVGINGLGAVNIVFPFTMLVNALFMVLNIGGSTIFAVCLGRGDMEGGNRAFRQGMMLLGVVSAVLCAAVIISTAFNIFGDWLLVFPLRMGTKGAALATGLSQIVALCVVLTHFLRKKGVLRFAWSRPEAGVCREIVYRGLPEGIGQLSTPVMTICMNLVLTDMIGDTGINAFSIISYVASFTLAVFFGASEGLQPLFGQSYGAGEKEELHYYFRFGLFTCFFGSVLVTGLILLFSRTICQLFGADAVTLEYTLWALPRFSWGFVVMAFNVMISAYLYSTEQSRQAVVINILRSIIVSAGVILTLPRLLGADAVWFTFGIYESIVLVVSVILLRRLRNGGDKQGSPA